MYDYNRTKQAGSLEPIEDSPLKIRVSDSGLLYDGSRGFSVTVEVGKYVDEGFYSKDKAKVKDWIAQARKALDRGLAELNRLPDSFPTEKRRR
jgi:hypothetical protein